LVVFDLIVIIVLCLMKDTSVYKILPFVT